jgi:hypothetical protein
MQMQAQMQAQPQVQYVQPQVRAHSRMKSLGSR